jgi:hypothetical protein
VRDPWDIFVTIKKKKTQMRVKQHFQCEKGDGEAAIDGMSP